MGRRGRPAKTGYRAATGRLSRAQGARPDHSDVVICEQPHRRHFDKLLGGKASDDQRTAYAIGRLRMIGEAENRAEATGQDVRSVLFGGARNAPIGPFGISERQFQAGVKWIETVGRERWVRSSPKDKPSAVAFMTARGIDLSGRDPTDGEATAIKAAFDAARRAVRAVDLRTRAACIANVVNAVCIDDRDPSIDDLGKLRCGLDALADHFFGPERAYHRINGHMKQRATWPHDERTIDVLYPDGEGGTRPAHREPAKRVRTRGKADRDHPFR